MISSIIIIFPLFPCDAVNMITIIFFRFIYFNLQNHNHVLYYVYHILPHQKHLPFYFPNHHTLSQFLRFHFYLIWCNIHTMSKIFSFYCLPTNITWSFWQKRTDIISTASSSSYYRHHSHHHFHRFPWSYCQKMFSRNIKYFL